MSEPACERSMRLLIITESNNPDWNSVPLVGHFHACALARVHAVTLVTHPINRAAIERKIRPYREIVYVDNPWLDRLFMWMFWKLFKGDSGRQLYTAVRVPFYLAFEWALWRRLRDRLARREFDAVIRITPLSPALPSLLSGRLRRIGMPYVLGPINGGLPWPPGFARASRDREGLGRLRALYRYLPYMKSTYRDASAILTASTQTWNEMSEHRSRCFFIPENGIDNKIQASRPPRPPGAELRLLFVGRLVPLKACDLALEAAAPLLRDGRATFTIVGDGRERDALEALVDRLDIRAAVRFCGVLAHAQVMQTYLDHDVLVFPSVRDFGGGVVFEALASGCVPVVCDYGGAGDIVTADVGIKVPLIDEARTRERFAQALAALAADPHRVEALSQQARRYAFEQLSWDGKARQVTQVLHWVQGQGPRPDLCPPIRENPPAGDTVG